MIQAYFRNIYNLLYMILTGFIQTYDHYYKITVHCLTFKFLGFHCLPVNVLHHFIKFLHLIDVWKLPDPSSLRFFDCQGTCNDIL